ALRRPGRARGDDPRAPARHALPPGPRHGHRQGRHDLRDAPRQGRVPDERRAPLRFRRRLEHVVFHDRARLWVQGGRGGDGSIHFRREKYVPKGGPDGGDGGAGGDVVLVADARRRDLSGIRPNQKVRAGRGGAGGGRLSHGARGEDAVLSVPVGTQVLDSEGRLIADLAHPDARVVVARGGVGGRGNKHFAHATRQTPRFAEIGIPGQEGEVELRLKLLADAALVGLPNAGKSSMLGRISSARTGVAAYPFTTIAPVVGTVESDGRQLTVADVPGLIA